MRVGGEPDLVVDDDMDRAARAVTLQPGEAEALRHHALACERRVAVEEERQHHRALGVVELVLLGAHLAEHHGVHDLEVRGVGGQRQVDVVAVELTVGRGAEVILDVARAFDVVRLEGAALELVEDGAQRLAHHLRQHVQAAAVGHAERDVAHAEVAAALDDLLQRGNDGFAAVEAEALGAGVLDAEELLEPVRLDELVEDRAAPLGGEADALVRPLDALLQPALLGAVGDVHELDAHGRAVGARQDVDHLAHGRELEAEHVVDEDRPVHVGFGEAVGGRRQLLVGVADEAERVELGVVVAAHPEGADHHDGANRIARGLLDVGPRNVGAGLLRLLGDLLAHPLLDFGGLAPVAVERGDELAVGMDRPVGPRPFRAARLGDHVRLVVLQALEEGLPVGIHAGRIGLIPCVELLQILGVATVEEGGLEKRVVRVLAGHKSTVLVFESAAPL